MKIAFTLATPDYMAAAKTVAESFVKHNPEFSFYLVLIDKNSDVSSLEFSKLSIIEIGVMQISGLDEMVERYSMFELSNALKPFCAQYFFETYSDLSTLIYLDSDILVYGRMSAVEAILEDNCIVLTPHMLTPPPVDGLIPAEPDFLNAGVYNGGFFAVKRCKESADFIQWWRERMKTQCLVNLAAGLFVDQIWLNFVPVYFKGVCILHDESYNVAYWNLHERSLTKTLSGEYLINSASPLTFFHYSGFNVLKPESISLHQSRYSFLTHPHLSELFNNYREAVLNNGYHDFRNIKSKYTRAVTIDSEPVVQLQHPLRTLYYRVRSYARRRQLKFVRSIFRKKSGLNLLGYFTSTSGVAEVGRFFAQYLKAADVQFNIYNVDSSAHKQLDSNSLKPYINHFTERPGFYKNIFFINADQIDFLESQARNLFLGRYNAAVFFWEFDDYFNFPNAFKVIDEVIAFTDFIATAVRKTAPSHVKVTKFPFPFKKSWEITKSPHEIRSALGIKTNEYVFIFNFDFLSVYQRKNPEAILKAFSLAFSASENVRLVLKSIHSESQTADYKSFMHAINGMANRDKVVLINDNLERNEFMSMINASDCYISLHRSEGLGLGLLEAMSMGKPVIGTMYGGNTDFMTTENSLPVNYKIVPVTSGAGPYKEGWLWADPDVNQAAGYMKRLYNDRIFSKMLGETAKASIESKYNERSFQNFFKEWMIN